MMSSERTLESIGIAEARDADMARANEVLQVPALPCTIDCTVCVRYAKVLYVRRDAGRLDQAVDARCEVHPLE